MLNNHQAVVVLDRLAARFWPAGEALVICIAGLVHGNIVVAGFVRNTILGRIHIHLGVPT